MSEEIDVYDETFETIGFDVNPERGQRSEFLKITITIPSSMLQAIKTFGLEKKVRGKKDCDVSSIVRDSVAFYLMKWSDDYKENIIKNILNPKK